MSLLLDTGRYIAAPQIEPTAKYFTFRADDPTRVIDWILIPPSWRFVDYHVTTTDLSDHCFVAATVQMP